MRIWPKKFDIGAYTQILGTEGLYRPGEGRLLLRVVGHMHASGVYRELESGGGDRGLPLPWEQIRPGGECDRGACPPAPPAVCDVPG